MAPSTKTRAAYAAIVLLAQLYVVYAASLYVKTGSIGFWCVLGAAASSAVGAIFDLFLRAGEDEAVREGTLTLEERRRIG